MKIASAMLALAIGCVSTIVPASGDAAKTASVPTMAKVTQMTDGEVRKIDRDAKKITLRHGEIKDLDMPAMTMVFQVKDAVLLEKINVGDRVNFTAERVGGAIVIMTIEPVLK
ncbi:MAG: copper-binding protein [Usitatibacteraceae bacterium]